MREILFRGQAANRDPNREYRTKYKNGDWVYGLLTDCENYMGFAEMTNTDGVSRIDVDKNTVGQYTGLTDKNGKKIFEGDIVHAIYKSGYTGISDKDFGIGVIKYSGTYYSGAAYQIDIIGEPGCRVFSASLQVEVIGNIHDNPELLKGGVQG